MSNLFFLNESVSDISYDSFKHGMRELIAIDRIANHDFKKHSSIYDIPHYETMCMDFGYEEQEILQFMEQLTPCHEYVADEEAANTFCGNNKNAFLGIDFSATGIVEFKQVINDQTYKAWFSIYLSKFEKLKLVVNDCFCAPDFEKEFNGYPENVRQSIIDDFEKAKRRNLITPYYPDTKIIKDVSSAKFKLNVLELRVYLPLALRVYFCVNAGNVYLASIDAKNSNDQTADIKNAYNILKGMLNIA